MPGCLLGRETAPCIGSKSVISGCVLGNGTVLSISVSQERGLAAVWLVMQTVFWHARSQLSMHVSLDNAAFRNNITSSWLWQNGLGHTSLA